MKATKYVYFYDNHKHDTEKFKEVSRQFVMDFFKNETAIKHLEYKGRMGGFRAIRKGSLV